MRAKEFLQQAYILDKRIDSGLMEISELREMACQLSSLNRMEKVNEGPNQEAPFVKSLERIWEMERLLDEEIDKLVDLKCEILRVISRVENDDQKMILRCRYVQCCTWDDIAKKMSYTTRWVHILHGRALKSVDSILNKT